MIPSDLAASVDRPLLIILGCSLLSLQIVAQKKMMKPLLLKYGKYAGKSTITVGLRFPSTLVCLLAGLHKVEVSARWALRNINKYFLLSVWHHEENS